jgi:hypothetical protein
MTISLKQFIKKFDQSWLKFMPENPKIKPKTKVLYWNKQANQWEVWDEKALRIKEYPDLYNENGTLKISRPRAPFSDIS